LGYSRQVGHYDQVSKTSYTQDYESFCALLSKLRGDRELTQTDLANRLGVPQSYVSKYEIGERRLDFVETVKVCEALGLTIEGFASAYSKWSRETQRPKTRPTGKERA
jgi:transcriptional regulator with XRE-family HTH domain